MAKSLSSRPACLGLTLLLCLGLAGGALAQNPKKGTGTQVTLNLKDAEISTLIATVSQVTGKNFVVDPRVKGKITVVSSSPMDAAGVYETFLSVLEVNGFAAIPSGESIKIVPEANAKTEGGGYVSNGHGLAYDDIVTHVIDIHNGSAQQLTAVLRPLVAQSGQLQAYPPSNSLIISDRAANVERMERLVLQIDQNGDRNVEIVPLTNAVADDVVRVLTQLAQAARAADPGSAQSTVIADQRSNSVLIGGDKAERDKLISLIHQLDQPQKNLGDTQVIYLNYADAQNLAPILEGYAQQVSKPASSKSGSMFGNSSSSSGAATPAAPVASTPASSYSGGGGNSEIRVLADKDTNSLVITAPPKTMQQLRRVISELDIKRSQVLVEAIVAEVGATKQSQLGVDWIAFNPNNIAAAGILNPSTSSALSGIGTALSASSSSGSSLGRSSEIGAAASLITTGATAVVGSFSGGALYGALLHALQSDDDTNILATPSLVTLDNEEAKIEVGQEVPELTGSFANTGTVSNGAVNPFQTIDRKDIGLKLGITPTIGLGSTIRLKIEFENSTISSGTAGTANLITNKRTVSDTVSVDGGQILVIGGLIQDQIDDSQNRIPLLSDIPLIGNLFKSRSITRTKQNLMIFIHPVILRERGESDYYTRRKYDDTRQAELNAANGPIPLIGGQRPVLYKYDVVAQPLPPGIAPPPGAAPGAAPGGATPAPVVPAPPAPALPDTAPTPPPPAPGTPPPAAPATPPQGAAPAAAPPAAQAAPASAPPATAPAADSSSPAGAAAPAKPGVAGTSPPAPAAAPAASQ